MSVPFAVHSCSTWLISTIGREPACTTHTGGQSAVNSAPATFAMMTEVVRPREENERGAYSEKNARCGHTREKKKRVAKPKVERHV